MIEYFTLETGGEIDSFVKNHPRGHYMQTTYYGRSRWDYHWNALALRDGEGRITASIALHSRPSCFMGKRLFYAPRGPVFSTMEEFRQIILAAKEYCREHKGYLIRIDPPISAQNGLFYKEAEKLGFRFDPRNDYTTYQPKCVYRVDLEGAAQEEVLLRFHSKTRYNIRLAQRRGVTVREGDLSYVPIFHAMMEETGKRDGFTCKPKEFYANFLDAMEGHARLLLAEKDGSVLAGAIEVILGRKAWYAYGCSFTQGREDMPNYLLQWEMIRYAMEMGCNVYDFRGVEGRPEPGNPHLGLHRFKRGFDAEFTEYVGQMDLTLRPLAKHLIRLGQRLFP